MSPHACLGALGVRSSVLFSSSPSLPGHQLGRLAPNGPARSRRTPRGASLPLNLGEAETSFLPNKRQRHQGCSPEGSHELDRSCGTLSLACGTVAHGCGLPRWHSCGTMSLATLRIGSHAFPESPSIRRAEIASPGFRWRAMVLRIRTWLS